MRRSREVHKRRSIRLHAFDYAAPGEYFVTICSHQRECLFGSAVDGEIQLTETGRVIARCWRAIPTHFPNVQVDAFVIMPNHVHGILRIVDRRLPVGATYMSPLRAEVDPGTSGARRPVAGSLGVVVSTFKAAVTRAARRRGHRSSAPIWQRNYYEHVVRDDRSLHQLRDHIAANPARWAEDSLNPARTNRIGHDDMAAYAPPLHATGSRENNRHDVPRTST
jgi:REP-associated tyrosine transposase